MKLDILYTLDSKGKIRVFECEVRYGMYEGGDPFTPQDYDACSVVTRTGLLGGKLIQKEELVKSGKQKRSIQEQAEFQVKSLWNEKLDEGYKSEELLIKEQNRRGFDIVDVIPESRIESLLHLIPEASYTNSNWDELPMLAHKFKDIKTPNFPYYAQPKLNGVRCLVKYKENTYSPSPIRLCSRGGQYYQVPHIISQLESLYRQITAINRNINYSKFLDYSTIFDGELYKHGVPLQDISGAARKEDNSMFASNNWLEYHIYDVINIKYLTQKVRSELLLQIATMIDGLPSIKFVQNDIVFSKEDVKNLHDKYISEGYEGLILREPTGIYEFNTRSKNLLKVKEYQDAEFKIIGYEIDPSKGEAESFTFELQNDINSLTFKARPTGTFAQKLEWLHNDSWRGKKATVRYFERSKDGLPLQGSVQHKLSHVLIEHLRPTDE